MQVLAICCMSILLVSLDNTIVNVALPTIHRDLDASLSQLQWIVDAYTVVLATLLILSGSIADRIGRKRVFAVGLGLFSVGSLLCSAAPSPGWLIAFRALQGVGGSMLNPVAMSIIRNVFTDPRERAQAIGVWGGVVGISMALGPVLGGALTDAAGWRSIFWINVPIGILAIVLVARVVPESRAARPRRLDPIGQVLAMVFLATLTYAIIEAGDAGWGSTRVQVSAILAAASIIGFVAHERRAPEPLIDLRFFRSVPFTGATLTAIAAFIALGRLPARDEPVSPGRPRAVTGPQRPLHAADGGVGVRGRAAVGPNRRPARRARAAAGRRARPRRREPDAHAAHAHHRHRRPAPGLLGLRPWLRDGQPADHERRGVRDAGRPGGRGGGRRVHEPAGRAYRSASRSSAR